MSLPVPHLSAGMIDRQSGHTKLPLRAPCVGFIGLCHLQNGHNLSALDVSSGGLLNFTGCPLTRSLYMFPPKGGPMLRTSALVLRFIGNKGKQDPNSDPRGITSFNFAKSPGALIVIFANHQTVFLKVSIQVPNVSTKSADVWATLGIRSPDG